MYARSVCDTKAPLQLQYEAFGAIYELDAFALYRNSSRKLVKLMSCPFGKPWYEIAKILTENSQ